LPRVFRVFALSWSLDFLDGVSARRFSRNAEIAPVQPQRRNRAGLAATPKSRRFSRNAEGVRRLGPRRKTMQRRQFVAVGTSLLLGRLVQAAQLPRDVKITRILGFDLPTRRSKLAGKNSQLGVHGDSSRDRMVRLFTNAGVEGLGNCRAEKEALAQLLGGNPFQDYDGPARRIAGPLGSQTMPLWDLAGKLLKRPVYDLLGGRVARPARAWQAVARHALAGRATRGGLRRLDLLRRPPAPVRRPLAGPLPGGDRHGPPRGPPGV